MMRGYERGEETERRGDKAKAQEGSTYIQGIHTDMKDGRKRER